MQSSNQLQDMLHSINRKSYPAYKSLKGAYQFNKYVLSIDHVQGLSLIHIQMCIRDRACTVSVMVVGGGSNLVMADDAETVTLMGWYDAVSYTHLTEWVWITKREVL